MVLGFYEVTDFIDKLNGELTIFADFNEIIAKYKSCLRQNAQQLFKNF
jgi:hypothetical protein